MSKVDKPYECTCSCHNCPGTWHFIPCCQGPCPRCGMHVTNQKKHQAVCSVMEESPGDIKRYRGGKPRHLK